MLSPTRNHLVVVERFNATSNENQPTRPRALLLPSSVARRGQSLIVVLTLVLVFISGSYRTVCAQEIPSLAGGKVGQAYEYQFKAAGGSGRLEWEKAGGAWDFGLNLNADGKLWGTPKKSGKFTISVRVKDASLDQQSVSQDFTIEVASDLRMLLPKQPLRVLAESPKSPPVRQAGAVQKQGEDDDSTASSSSDSTTISVSNKLLEEEEKWIDLKTGKIKDTILIDTLVGKNAQWENKEYCIVHVVRWMKMAGPSVKYESKELWYLYRRVKNGDSEEWVRQNNQDGRRIYGSKHVAVLIIHLNALQAWDIKYNVNIAGKIPAPYQNLLELVSVASGLKAAKAGDESKDNVHLWGRKILDGIVEIPSNMSVEGNTQFTNEDGNVITQQPKEFIGVYDNEGRYRWDVSVGLPFKENTDLEYNFSPTDSKTGIVTVKNKTRQNAYGFFNLYFRKVDLKEDGILRTPHLVFGLPIAGKPLNHPMAGVGLGVYKYPLKFNFFAGAVFNRVQSLKTLKTGDSTDAAAFSNDLESRRVTKLIFGVNIPVSQFKKALK